MILITAPTGKIGSQVVGNLLGRGLPLRVVAREPARLADEVRERVEVVEGSHGDTAVIDQACKGVESVFWLTPNISDAPTLDATFTDFARPACDAFSRHGVARVVGISALGRGAPQAGHAGLVTASLAMDDLITSSGIAYKAVVNPSFMNNLLNQIGAIKEQGKFFMTIAPDLKAPTVATCDIAATAARLLSDESWSTSGEVACLGPEDLSPTEMAGILSDALRENVTYQRIPGHAFKDRMTGFGMSEVWAQGMVDMFDAKDQGIDTFLPRTTESTTPTTFRQWCEDVLKPAVAA